LRVQKSKISLGTAKLGIEKYGFSSNKLPTNKKDFLEQAYSIGIRSIDTSPRYGDSEKIIGESLLSNKNKPLISSKIDNLKANDPSSPKKMVQSVKQSINRMNISSLDICYLHQNELSIISDPYIHEGLNTLKQMNLINYSGASIYSFDELDYSVSCLLYDYVQAPINILDISYYERILSHKTNIKIAARSIFLQGIIFNKDLIAQKIKNSIALQNELDNLERLCNSFDIQLNIACMAYVHSLDKINQIIIGTASTKNLKANIQSASYDLDKNLTKMIDDLASQPKSWTNPRNWSG